MTEIYLVRHADAVFSDDEMRPLSETGMEQAREVADALVRMLPQALYSSPYKRARQTIEPLAARLGLPIVAVDDFRERTLTSGFVEDFQAAAKATWDDPDFAHPGGESNRTAQHRGVAALHELAARHRNERIVVATHGTLLALMLRSFDRRVGYEFWSSITVPDIYVLTFETSTAHVAVHRFWGMPKRMQDSGAWRKR